MLIAVLLLTACGKIKEKTEREEMGLRGNVQSVTEVSFRAYEDGEELVVVGLERSDFSNMASDFMVVFNLQGDAIERDFYFSGELMMWNKYYYEDGLLRFSEVFFAETSDSVPAFMTFFTYNQENKMLTSTMYDIDSVMVMYQEYSYDKEGHLYDETVFDGNRERVGRNFYTYNKKGQMIETRICGPSGELLERRVQAYNSRGEVKKSEVFDAENVLVEVVTAKHDKNGNVQQESYESIEDEVETIHKYKYNAHGDVEKIIYDASVEDEPIVVTFTYEYDEQGNWTVCLERQAGEVMFLIERHLTYFEK